MGPPSPSSPTRERLPGPAQGPGRPQGRSGVFQATWGPLSSDSLLSGRRSPSEPVNLPRGSASPVPFPEGAGPWFSLAVSPRGPLASGALCHCLLGAPGLASASIPTPSGGALLSESPSLRSLTHWLLPPSRPSVGPSPWNPSLPTPSPPGREAPPETGAEAAGPDVSHANTPLPNTLPGDPSLPARGSPHPPARSQGPRGL